MPDLFTTDAPAEPFTLSNPTPKRKPATFENTKATQQTLITGLDCLPGQQDLFGGLDDQTAREQERAKAKPTAPVRTAPPFARFTASQRRALHAIGAQTCGTFDPWRLAGPHLASFRASVLTELLNWPKRIPQAKAGVTALKEALYAMAGPQVIQGECQAERDDRLEQWAKSLDVYRNGERAEDAAARMGYTL